MGFSNNKSNVTYIRVANGKLIVKAKDNAPGAVKRTIGAGKHEGEETWEYHHDAYTGHIRKISIKDSENYGAQINILVADDEGLAVITIPMSGRHSTKLVQNLANLNLDEPVQFCPYKFQARDKESQKLIADKYVQGWVLRQNDEKIEDSFSIKDLPDLEKVKRKGKMEWDDTNRTEELRNRLQAFIDDTFNEEEDEDEAPKKQPKPQPKKAPAKSVGDDDDDDGPIDLDEDDVPF